jgi:hypothetical protein
MENKLSYNLKPAVGCNSMIFFATVQLLAYQTLKDQDDEVPQTGVSES